ncbi:MAG: glutathione S-transferase family protein, partial [Myxococcota bacterium]
RLRTEAPASEPASPAPPPRRGLLGFLRSGAHAPAASMPPEAERLREEVGGRLADLDRLLADRPFFYSNRISMADLAVFAMLKSLSRDGIPGTAARLFRHLRLVEFMKRVEQATSG